MTPVGDKMVPEENDSRPVVLIVEDDPTTRKLLLRFLSEFNPIAAVDGVDGWEKFHEIQPAVVITDLRMPQMDGMTLFKNIRNESPATPVIILSGRGTLTDAIEAIHLGASDYLEKPIANKEFVIHAVRKAFEKIRYNDLQEHYQQTLEQEVADKTAQFRLELKAREEAEQKMKMAEREWQRTFDAIPDLIAIIDKDYKFIRTNKAMAQVLGRSSDEIEGTRCYEVLHGAAKPPNSCPHHQLLLDGKKCVMEQFEKCLGGHVEVTVVPYHSEDGKTLLGSVHIFRDINERKTIEEEGKRMQTQLLHAQKLESVGQLAAGIAHEINTPVQFVSANNEFLNEAFEEVSALITTFDATFQQALKGTVDPDQLTKTSEALEDADWEYLSAEIPTAIGQNMEGLKRVTSIVRAMKEFSHPGSKEKERRNLNDILNTTATVARNEWKYVSDLVLDLDPELAPVDCFADDMGQVFLNMIINAAHAIEEKLGRTPVGDKGTIRVETRNIEEYVEVRIIDNGSGIPVGKLQKIFEPFYTTKKVGHGTGQGLAIAWDIVHTKHAGVLEVESREGEGSTFIIKIPR